MKFAADFHLHSPYARAVSPAMTLENLNLWAAIKGVAVLGTGDFTHPKWIREIKDKLEPAEEGLYKLKSEIRKRKSETNFQISNRKPETRFMLTVEISSIYSKNGKVRRIHNLIFSPSIETAEKINLSLGAQGNLKSDGRPILGMDAKDLLKIVLGIDSRCFFVPAHVWTPWFSVFGSKSGFDSLEECFEEYSKHIYALETGLSSDPAMNWRLSALDKYALISNSDSHSLRRIGREANFFDCELSYAGIIDAIKSKSKKKFLSTVEYFPEEGMYHYDGHRACQTRAHPDETKRLKNLCSACLRPTTVGVLHRVGELADRPEGFKPKTAIPFVNMVPLDEIIAEALKVVSVSSQKVLREYKKITEKLGSELDILLQVRPSDLRRATLPEIAEGITRARAGKLKIEPGYDGEYGHVKIFY